MKLRQTAAILSLFAFAPGASLSAADSLREAAGSRLLVGCALATRDLGDPKLTALVTEQFGCVTPEYEFMPEKLVDDARKFTFETSDRVVEFAEAHHLPVLGHMLVWHFVTRKWLFEKPGGKPLPREEALANLKCYIDGVVGHYQGRIKMWDVVNEGISDQDGEYLRDTPARRAIGDDYIEKAFEFAHAADPQAELYYNDYNIEQPGKLERTLKLVRALQAKGVRLDAVGIQGHWLIDWPPTEMIEKAIDALAATGVKVMITELDVDLLPRTGSGANMAQTEQGANPYPKSLPPEQEEKLSKRYGEIVAAIVRHPAVTMVGFWGTHDGRSWLNDFPVKGRTNYPLLFDRQLQPKPAFAAVIKALRELTRKSQTLSATGLFADLSDLSPAPGVLPYAVNLPFWSDHADKRRWFVVPDAASQMSWAREGAWRYPDGMIWVKHFDMEMTRGDVSTQKRIETRVLVKNPAGIYGVSYRWNDAGTDATLVADEGADFPLNIVDGGNPAIQNWHIPSRTECTICHNAQAGYSLSFNTRQLNLDNNINGFHGNQLTVLKNGGFFDNEPDPINFLPRHLRSDESAYPIEARARSYLAVNCAFCHQPGGVANAFWDGRAEVPLAQTGLLYGTAYANGGDPANQLIIPGDLLHSIVPNRMAAANGFTRMPPIASNVLDADGIALIRAWISDALPDHLTYDQWRQKWFASTSPDGEPAADPEGDGATNQEEFLFGTNPLDAASFRRPQVSISGDTATVTIDVPANRSVQVETSTDLLNWSLWDTPGNNTIPLAGGSISITGPMLAPQQFFRLRIWDN